jgi:hypothetical protein
MARSGPPPGRGSPRLDSSGGGSLASELQRAGTLVSRWLSTNRMAP